MTRYPPPISPRQGAYGWQRVKETSYRRIDAGCFCDVRHPDREWRLGTIHPRHCERSEAIHLSEHEETMDCFAALAMTGIRFRILAAFIAEVLSPSPI
jgi:hypothetical protein